MIFSKLTTSFFRAVAKIGLFFVFFSLFALPAQAALPLPMSTLTPIPSPIPIVPYSSPAEKLFSLVAKPSPLHDVEETIAACKPTPETWIGKASYYTMDGCLGCNELRQMANGEILDDKKLTLAFMRAPLNSTVEVKNLHTKQKVLAKVTDRGGFEGLNRIADVSEKVKNEINLRTDESPIQITVLSCA